MTRSSDSVRRSWLVLPVSLPDLLEVASTSRADVIVVDLSESVVGTELTVDTKRAVSLIDQMGTACTQVFVQVKANFDHFQLLSCIRPGLSGVVITGLASPRDLIQVDGLLDKYELDRELTPGSVEVVACLETAAGNLRAAAIAASTPRITGLTLGRVDLEMDLRPEPSGEIHMLPFLMQRLVLIANAYGKTPIGAWWMRGDRGLSATPTNTQLAVHKGKQIGFRGSFCVREDQVEPLRRGFTPSQEEIDWAKGVVADGKLFKELMVRANEILTFASLCAARDVELIFDEGSLRD